MTILSILQSAFHYATTILLVVAIVRITVWFNNINQINDVCRRFNSIQKSVDLLKEDMALNRKLIEQQMNAMVTQQRQFTEHTSNMLEMSSHFDDVFECIDLLNNRLLEMKFLREIQDPVVDIQNEEIFDRFIADCLVANEDGKIGTGEVETLFNQWCESNPRSAGPTNGELNAYMSRTFHWKRHIVDNETLGAWVGISPR